MVRSNSIRWTVARVAGVVGATLLLWAGAPLGQSVHAAGRTQETVTQALVGTWVGSALGDTGACGAEYGQWTFFRNNEYSYTMNSDYQEIRNQQGQITRINDCGGITNAGYYAVRGSTIIFHWIKCNYPCAAGTAAAGFRFYNINTLEIIDSGRVYVYYRR